MKLNAQAPSAPDTASAFDEDTHVTREGGDQMVIADASSGFGDAGVRWRASVSDRWDIAGKPNGGYLLALAARAMSEHSGRPHALAATAYYLVPPAKGALEVTTHQLKRGRIYTTMTASMRQGSRERVRVSAAMGDLDDLQGPTHDVATAPSLPPPEQCVTMLGRPGPSGGPTPEIFDRFDLRLAPGPGWLHGERSGYDRIEGWIRFADGTPVDTASLPLFVDAFPPAVLDLVATRWVPTVELTVYVRARPVAGWLRGCFRTRCLVNGVLEEDGELYDDSGRLVAQSRQLAIALPAAPDQARSVAGE
jgi:acyl-CoA thioesterase